MKFYIRLCGVALGITGLAKVFTTFGHVRALDAIDPLFGISFRVLLLLVGIAELSIAVPCICGNNDLLNSILTAWIATGFVVYRLGIWFVGWHGICPCLGHIEDVLPIRPETTQLLMKGVLAYLFLGSYATLFWLWRQRKNAVPSAVGAASL